MLAYVCQDFGLTVDHLQTSYGDSDSSFASLVLGYASSSQDFVYVFQEEKDFSFASLELDCVCVFQG